MVGFTSQRGRGGEPVINTEEELGQVGSWETPRLTYVGSVGDVLQGGGYKKNGISPPTCDGSYMHPNGQSSPCTDFD